MGPKRSVSALCKHTDPTCPRDQDLVSYTEHEKRKDATAMTGIAVAFMVGAGGACGLAAGVLTGGATLLLGPRMSRLVPYKVSVPVVTIAIPGGGLYAAHRAFPEAFHRPSAMDASIFETYAIIGAAQGYALGCLGILALPTTCRILSQVARRRHAAFINHLREEMAKGKK